MIVSLVLTVFFQVSIHANITYCVNVLVLKILTRVLLTGGSS